MHKMGRPLHAAFRFSAKNINDRLAPKLEALSRDQGVDTTAVAIAWLMAHPVGVLPVMGSNQLDRIAAFGQAGRVVIDRQTWFELYELANGHEVP